MDAVSCSTNVHGRVCPPSEHELRLWEFTTGLLRDGHQHESPIGFPNSYISVPAKSARLSRCLYMKVITDSRAEEFSHLKLKLQIPMFLLNSFDTEEQRERSANNQMFLQNAKQGLLENTVGVDITPVTVIGP